MPKCGRTGWEGVPGMLKSTMELYQQARLAALGEAKELLWDNIETSIWRDDFLGLSDDEIPLEKIKSQHSYYHPALVSFQTSFIPTILDVKNDKARLVLQYGASRRIHSIYSAVNTIAEIAYPARTDVCTKEEHGKLGDALLVFYVSIPAFFDALAMSAHRIFLPKKLTEEDADLFSRKTWQAFNMPKAYEEIKEYVVWRQRLKTQMRHHFVHRIPPYVPSAEHSPEDAKENGKLQLKYQAAIQAREFEHATEVLDRQERLGRFCDKIYFFERDEYTHINPTVIEDCLMFQIVALEMLELLLADERFC